MAEASLFSPNWFRVADLHPQLADHVMVRRQPVRGSQWYVFTDTASGRQHRLNDMAYQFAARCDGKRTSTEIWKTLLQRMGDQAPSQEEVLRLIGQMSENGLLHLDKIGDIDALFEHQRERSARQRRGRLNPLFFRLDLFNPESLLRRLDGVSQLLFRSWVLVPWLLTVCLALIMAVSHWSELLTHAARYLLTPHYLLLTWLCFPLIKGLHELAHGMAIRRWGGEVTQMGIALLVLVPAPYIDASQASAFRFGYQRAMVSAAGILTELLIAALALFVWLSVEPGLVRDIAFVLAFIGSFSTLLFNGNPLLKFDGYYLMSDLLNLPNLASRSQQYWAYLAQRYLLNLKNAPSPQPDPGERGWLLLYAPLSWCYKVFIGFLISFWLASKLLFFGIAAGLFFLYSTIVSPLLKILGFAFHSPVLGNQRLRARALSSALLLSLLLAIGVLPMPAVTVAEGVVWPPERAILRAGTDGFIVSLAVRDGDTVQPGQLVAVLEDQRLQARQRELRASIDSLLSEHYQVFLSDPVKAKNLEQATQRFEAELAQIEEKIAFLEVRSQIQGRLVMPKQQDMPGTFMKRGAMLGYVFNPDEVFVRAVVDEDDIAVVRERTESVEALLADNPGQAVTVRLARETPAATQTLPSPALGDRMGGSYLTDPGDADGVTTMEPFFLVELALPANATARMGGLAWVQFNRKAEPLAVGWVRKMRQLFLKHFSVAD